MVNISRLITTLGKLEGSSARFTVSGKQMLQGLEKGKNVPTEISDTLAGLIRKHPKLKADVAYKSSEQGFTVGTVTLRDGKQVIGNGAASISGLGTEQAVVKMRLNAGKNGEIFQYRGFNDLAHTPKVQDLEMVTSMKNGVIESTTKCGKFSASRTYLDIPKATEASGLKEEGADVLKQVNKILDKVTGKIRDLFAGKDICTMKQVKPLKAKDIEDKLKSCYKMPNGKLVEKTEFEETIKNYFRARGEQAIKNPHQADEIIKELKNLSKQVKNQTGYEIPNDWTKYLGEVFFK